MPALPRRRLLAGAAALLSGLAGCSESTTDTDAVPGRRRPENVARDPDFVSLRGPETGGPLAWLPPEDAAGSGDAAGSVSAGDATSDPAADAIRWGLVGSRTRADRLRFAEVDGAAEARQFVAETNFERETLYLDRQGVPECFVLELCYVTWSRTEIDTQYGRYYRDADVSCRTDATDETAWLIRVPDALDPEGVSSRGSGMSGNGCRYPPYMRTTEEGNSTNATRTAVGDTETTVETSETSADSTRTEAER